MLDIAGQIGPVARIQKCKSWPCQNDALDGSKYLFGMKLAARSKFYILTSFQWIWIERINENAKIGG